MKLIIDKDNKIVCKITRNVSNRTIAREIKTSIHNQYIIKRSIKKPIDWIQNDIFIAGIDNLEVWDKLEVDLWLNTISIYGGNGLIELEIIDLKHVTALNENQNKEI